MTGLVERLGSAAVGSRELDFAVAEAAGSNIREGWAEFYAGGEFGGSVKLYTTSLDAALTLAERVLPGCEWELIRNDERCVACLGDPALFMEGEAATPALALCIASLKAGQSVSPSTCGVAKGDETQSSNNKGGETNG